MKAASAFACRILLTMPCALLLLAIAKGPSAVAATDGFADWDGTNSYTVTGGQGGPSVTVTNETDLAYYAHTNVPYVVQILGTITTNLVEIKSDKTLIGLGTNATFIGRLKMSSVVGEDSVTNVIIRNLTISDPFGGDGISMQNRPQHIWVDHCTFYDCGDGEIDVTEESDFITVSWCKFFYTFNSGHNFVNLVGSSDTYSNDIGKLHVTFHHNWWSTLCIERMPRVRFGQVHVYDNYYNCISNSYCAGVGNNSQILLENNHFDNIKNPWKNYSSSDQQGLIHWNDGNVFTNGTIIPTWASNSTVFTPPYAYSLDDATGLPVSVTAYAGAGKLDIYPPKASLAASPTNGAGPLTVTFTDTSTGTQPISLSWDLGDSTTTNTDGGASFAHTYAIGTYTVTLTASNAFGVSTLIATNMVTSFTSQQAWQFQYFGCTDCPQAADTADPDGDGQDNLAEYLSGTSPTNSQSALRITSATRQGDDVVIAWTTAGGKTNAVQAAPGDGNGGYTTNFIDLSGPIVIDGSGDVTTNYVDSAGATNSPSRFYRIRLVP